jgi:hypothetical protein
MQITLNIRGSLRIVTLLPGNSAKKGGKSRSANKLNIDLFFMQ